MHRTDCFVRHGPGFASGKTGNPKIRDLDGAILKQHDILRFDVAVNNPLFMCMLKRAQNLYGKMKGFFPFDLFLLIQIFFESNSVNIFFYDILNPVTEADIVNFYNIGVGQNGNRF